jgi:hypothetical protein
MATKKECFISVDVETSGPIPGDYSLVVRPMADGSGMFRLSPVGTEEERMAGAWRVWDRPG